MLVAKVINKIAVVEIHGGIGGKIRSPDMEKLVNRILEDRRMRAVVLDIDSPGGTRRPRTTSTALSGESRVAGRWWRASGVWARRAGT